MRAKIRKKWPKNVAWAFLNGRSRGLSAREVAQLQEWFEPEARGFLAGLDESHLNRLACPILILVDDANELAVIIETAPQSGVQQFFRGHELTVTEWDETRSGLQLPPGVEAWKR